MAVHSNSQRRPSTEETDVAYFNPDQPTAEAVYSLLDAVDSESIAEEFDIGKHSNKHDFDNHLKVAVREGIDPSDSLAELEATTHTAAEMQKMAASTFSRYTNDRDYRAVVRNQDYADAVGQYTNLSIIGGIVSSEIISAGD